jgi:hypothetical protein
MFRGRTAQGSLGPSVMEDPCHVVERFADVDPAPDQVRTGLIDVVDRELEPLGRAGRADVTPVPKMIEQAEPGGVSCTTL